MFVRVAVPVPALDLLTYRIPDGVGVPAVGARVVVPIGPRSVTGIVVELNASAADLNGKDVKAVRQVLDPGPFVPPEVVDLARWTSEYYAAGAGGQQPERRNFVACPIVQDTKTVPCWLSEHEGERYYLGIQTDISAEFHPPYLGHQVLVHRSEREHRGDRDPVRAAGSIGDHDQVRATGDRGAGLAGDPVERDAGIRAARRRSRVAVVRHVDAERGRVELQARPASL